MALDVWVISDADDFDRALPRLASGAQITRRASLNDGYAGNQFGDVAIVDARADVRVARTACRRLTTRAPAMALVAVVAGADELTVDVGGEWNVDDVMPADTSADELLGRLRMAIARRRSATDGALKFGALLLHPAKFTASLDGEALGLTRTEFKLLSFLVQHAGRAFTRTRLMHEAWGYDCNGRVRSVDVHVRRLRAKFGPQHQSIVDTVRGVGYMAGTPPYPEWIASAPARSPIGTSDPVAH